MQYFKSVFLLVGLFAAFASSAHAAQPTITVVYNPRLDSVCSFYKDMQSKMSGR